MMMHHHTKFGWKQTGWSWKYLLDYAQTQWFQEPPPPPPNYNQTNAIVIGLIQVALQGLPFFSLTKYPKVTDFSGGANHFSMQTFERTKASYDFDTLFLPVLKSATQMTSCRTKLNRLPPWTSVSQNDMRNLWAQRKHEVEPAAMFPSHLIWGLRNLFVSVQLTVWSTKWYLQPCSLPTRSGCS